MNKHETAVDMAVKAAKARVAKNNEPKPKPKDSVSKLFADDSRRWIEEFMVKSGKSKLHRFIICRCTPRMVIQSLALLAFEQYKDHELNTKYRVMFTTRDRLTSYKIDLRSDLTRESLRIHRWNPSK